MKSWSLRLLLAAALLPFSAAYTAPPTPTYRFTGGNWWNGKSFEPKTMYSVNGLLRSRPPASVSSTFDLQGGFVIPPLAEGHNHWLEPDQAEAYAQCYLADGVYYVQDQANSPHAFSRFRDQVNLPTSVDYVTAALGFTGPDGHPIQIIEQFRDVFGVFPKDWTVSDIDGGAVLIVESKEDIDRRWPLFRAAQPAFLKAFLLFSEEYEARRKDPKTLYKRGMDPALLPYLVGKAHRDGFKVSVHVYSAQDFRNAVSAGVDEIAHFPGTGFDPALGVGRFRITAEDAREAARRGIKVMTTLGWLREDDDLKAHQRVVRDEVIIPNLKLLKEAGVPILLGSDQFRQTVLPEILTVRDLGVYSNAELLKMAVSDTVRSIFPRRKVGQLRDGYEADFLVLQNNPLETLDNLRSIKLRIKQGRELKVPDALTKRESLSCVG